MDRLKEFFKKAKAWVTAAVAAVVGALYFAWDWVVAFFG